MIFKNGFLYRKVHEDGILVYKFRFVTLTRLFSETRGIRYGSVSILTSYTHHQDLLVPPAPPDPK